MPRLELDEASGVVLLLDRVMRERRHAGQPREERRDGDAANLRGDLHVSQFSSYSDRQR
jgi:hypothetical protein